jgi:hypothetical protein
MNINENIDTDRFDDGLLILNHLVGTKIQSIKVSNDNEQLIITTDKNILGIDTYGDCCSETWFSDILGVKFLINATVSLVESVSMDGYNVDDGRCKQLIDEVYGYKITTNKGNADIIFRNSSNGYYGGGLCWISEEYKKDDSKFIEITNDWEST